jgi:hypothetical protein
VSRLLGSFLDGPRSPAPLWARIVTMGFLLAVFSLLSWTLLASTTRNWEAIWKYRTAFWQGWMLTVALSLVSLVLSTLIGLAAALARRSSILIIRYLSIWDRKCWRLATRECSSHRTHHRADLSIRYFPTGTPAGSSTLGGTIRLHREGFIAALDHWPGGVHLHGSAGKLGDL